MKTTNLRWKKQLAIVCIILLVLTIALGAVRSYLESRFLWGTVIENVPCSFLSIDEAIERINLEKGTETVTFRFINDKTYEVVSNEIGIRVDEAQVVRIFNQQHLNPKEAREYDMDGFILADTKMLREFLKQIPELQEENMVEPQNAYITWDKKEFSIHKEELGNVIIFEEAVNFALEIIKKDEKQVDFSPITQVTPEILSEDLENERDELNSILNSTINFELSDGNIVTLDSSIIKNWVYQDENGKFMFDIENGAQKFVEELAVKVNEANSMMCFTATDCEELATVNVPKAVRAQLDKEKEIVEILSLIGNSEPVSTKPIYDRKLISDMLTSYIEIDISRQHIWFYKDGKLIVDTPCVTGNVRDGYNTPTGVFFLLNKNRKVNLEGSNKDGSKYSSFVEYWMRFYQGVGMHDATWRGKFGGSIYKTSGSHGCVNMPKKAAATTYENIDETMPIIVYQSNL